MIKYSLLIFLILCSLLYNSLEANEDTALRIVLDDSFAPYSWKDKEEKTHGVYPLILEELFSSTDLRYKIELYPWKRALQMLENNDVIIAGIYKTDNRVQKYFFSQPIFKEKLVVYTNIKNKIDFRNLKDLKNKRVGINFGWSVNSEFEELSRNNFFKVQTAKQTADNFKKLEHGRIDVFIVDELNGDFVLREISLNHKIVKLETPVSESDSFIAISKNYKNAEEVIERINKAIIKFNKLERLNKILERSDL